VLRASYDLANNVLTDARCCLRQFLDELADQTPSLVPESRVKGGYMLEVPSNAFKRRYALVR
jgi:hypothetical protein